MNRNRNENTNPWRWVDKGELTGEDLMEIYRIKGYSECPFKSKPCKCKRNPYCLWGLGDIAWMGDFDPENKDKILESRNEGQIMGLQNLGATCYMNSLLQLWYHNPLIRKTMLKWIPPWVEQDGLVNYKPKCAVSQLQALFARMKASKQRTIDTKDLVEVLQLDAGQQQDAQEFSSLFLQCIIRKLQESNSLDACKAFKNCFTGVSKYKTECQTCKYINLGNNEEFTDLQLSVQKTLEEAFQLFFKAELLTDDNKYFCIRCNSRQVASRQIHLLKLPEVLNIQLLRFVYDANSQERKKVSKLISFPEILDMTRFVDGNSGEQHIFQLNAVLIHNGNNATSGHYISHIKDLNSGKWFECNDERIENINNIKKCTETLRITGDGDGDGTKTSNRSSKGAYMLVYTRQKYFTSVEPEEDLPEFLRQLIQKEDDEFDVTNRSIREAKEKEIEIRAERQSEIAKLFKSKYPQAVQSEFTNGNGEQENFNYRSNGNVASQTIRLNSMDFISTNWLEDWLHYNPLKEKEALSIANESIKCMHGKLSPPLKVDLTVMYKIIPSDFGSFLYNKFGGDRLHGDEALCRDCVLLHGKFLIGQRELDEGSRRVMDSIRKCSDLIQRGGNNINMDDKCFIGTETLKEWKKKAKEELETRYGIRNLNAVEENVEGDATINFVPNDELRCIHGSLNIERRKRKILHTIIFDDTITKHFPQARVFAASEEECPVCLMNESDNNSVLETYKQLANTEKVALQDLFKKQRRPSVRDVGAYYIVPTSFISSWYEFIKDPTSTTFTSGCWDINVDELLCECCRQLGLKYSLEAVVYRDIKEGDLNDVITLLHEWELDILLENRTIDTKIKVIIQDVDGDLIYSYEGAGLCEISIENWIVNIMDKYFDYDGEIFIRTCEDFEWVEDEVPSKFARTESEPSNCGIRRSLRSKRTKPNDKKYRIQSSCTIQNFQVSRLYQDFRAGLSDQHLYWNGKEITEAEKQRTFKSLRIPVGSVIYLKIDKSDSTKDAEDKKQSSERGFSGTALLG